ncbi:hypothetical protein V5F77_02630 [Xanthobacter sp. DSM 24535]|uniref:hypothetical protein n=1 Tax=Roseixanthobacter psychrophilus TaxID=3119917 RepID=UPI0037290F15
MSEPIILQQQASAVECCFLEWRNSVERLEKLPVGRGGVDPAALKLKRMRVKELEAAASTLRQLDERTSKEAARGAV